MTVSTVDAGASRTGFRTCPATGRQIHLGAAQLIKAHAVASVVALLVGAIAAVLLVLTRWQAVHLLPALWYYRILGVHGIGSPSGSCSRARSSSSS
jgi:cytochrome c oxidase subunit 1